MSKRYYKIIITIIALLLAASSAVLLVYLNKKTNLNKQLAKVQSQLKELPELEKDIFTKCVEGKESTAQSIAFCQENTQKQMHTLAQDLNSAKKDLEGKKWYQVIQ